jgi:hypothetical protein
MTFYEVVNQTRSSQYEFMFCEIHLSADGIGRPTVPGDQSAAIAVSSSERRVERATMKAAERHVLAAEHHPLKGGTAKH